MEEKERKKEEMNEVAQVYHEPHVARTFPKSKLPKNTGIPKQHSRDCHIEYSTIFHSQNIQLGLAEYELLRNSYAISQQRYPRKYIGDLLRPNFPAIIISQTSLRFITPIAAVSLPQSGSLSAKTHS